MGVRLGIAFLRSREKKNSNFVNVFILCLYNLSLGKDHGLPFEQTNLNSHYSKMLCAKS